MMSEPIGQKRHTVQLLSPGPSVPDGDGGYVDTFTALNPPTVKASIRPATSRDLERVTAGTVISTASHIVKMRYHGEVTTKTRIIFGARIFNVTGVSNPEERNEETIVVCEEVVT